MASTSPQSQFPLPAVEYEDEYVQLFFMPTEIRNKNINQLWTKLIIIDLLSCFLLISGLIFMIIEVFMKKTNQNYKKIILIGKFL